MPATLDQITAAKTDRGILARCIAAADQLGIPGAQSRVESEFGRIVAAEIPDGGGSTSIAYALDYHRTDMTNAVTQANDGRSNKPSIPLDLTPIGESPLGVSDATITAAVRAVLLPPTA